MQKGTQVYVTGIDMKAAFDTILREELLEELRTFLDEDEVRLGRVLLRNATISIKINDKLSEPFPSNIGSPQGDGISGTFSNIYFEKSIRKVRECRALQISKAIIDHDYGLQSNLPDEMEYADDCDFP